MNRKFKLAALMSFMLLSSCGVSGNASEEACQPSGEVLKVDVRARRENNEEAGDISIYGNSLVLEDAIHVNYYVENNVANTASKGLKVWKKTAPGDYTADTPDYTITDSSTVTSSGKTYSVFTFGHIAAKEMTDYIYAAAYAVDADGAYHYTALDKYSILDYCLAYKDSTSTKDDGTGTLGELVTAIMEYGAAAQTYFNYNTDRLANATYYSVTVVGGTLADGSTSGLYTENETIELDGYGWKDDDGNVYTSNEIAMEDLINEDPTAEGFTLTRYHEYSGSITSYPTCTEAGIMTFTCDYCDDFYTEEIEATGHSYTSVVTREATCIMTGIVTNTCTVCGDSYQENIYTIDHQYEVTYNDGTTIVYTCTICHSSYSIEVVP